MLIRFGFEIELESTAPVPMLLALSTHSDMPGRLIGQDHVRVLPDCKTHRYLDRFGNWITRLVTPAGPYRLWSDCAVELDGLPDPQLPLSRQHPVQELPDDIVQHLIPSRYCDSDNLAKEAWGLFAGLSGRLGQGSGDHDLCAPACNLRLPVRPAPTRRLRTSFARRPAFAVISPIWRSHSAVP